MHRFNVIENITRCSMYESNEYDFQQEAKCNGLSFEELKSHNNLEQVMQKGKPYFLLEISPEKIWFTKINTAKTFPINFGRDVLASESVLNKPDNVDWRNCLLGKEKEECIVKGIREKFHVFND